MDKYIFPFVLTQKENKLVGDFPDLPGCIACGDTEEELFKSAKEAMALHLYGMEEEGYEIPSSSKILDLKLEPGQYIVMIEVSMIPFRDKMRNKAVNKTLTIPKWLDDLAVENGVNFSHVLQDALKTYLGVNNPEQK
ncbi:MAG TPA: pilus assembly protein HicB [Firmicutes bacterium]|jgi:predicted RNase H-like HicB family nuclease|nr:pilus assembly protein HicB [Bacillota bacterium]